MALVNPVLIQYFEWYLPNDGKHWQRLKEDAGHLAEMGISDVWFPPACKATSSNDVGYGIYDLWDLGEFDQHGDVRTKYGTKEELLAAIATLKEHGIRPIADVVLNHKANADGKEKFHVLKMNPQNRQEALSEPFEIEAWTYFNFPGRQAQYSDFEWHWYHFSGIDYDALHEETGLFMILGDQKGWADDACVDCEFGNYDYLMFADIDYSHPDVANHVMEWAKWFIEETGFQGFRLDAVKHIDYQFVHLLVETVLAEQGPEFYIFGEYWKSDLETKQEYLEQVDYTFDLFDVGLHMNFHIASRSFNRFDMRTIFDGTLVSQNPMSTVTFVDNHDTQEGQALASTVQDWFIPLAYALILLRRDGLPCVFYGDYYGEGDGSSREPMQEQIDPLLILRRDYAHGEQVNYFDHANTIGWTRLGDEDHPHAMAVIMTNGEDGFKDMELGQLHAGKTYYDFLGHCQETVTINEEGWGSFQVKAGSVSVWVEEEAGDKNDQ